MLEFLRPMKLTAAPPRLLMLLSLASCGPQAPARTAEAPGAKPAASASFPKETHAGHGCPRARARGLIRDASAHVAADLDRALASLEEATQLDPEDDLLQAELARAYGKKAAWAQAGGAALEAARIAPDRADHWALAAQLLASGPRRPDEAWRWGKVEAAATSCIAADPRRAACHQLLAEALHRRGDEQGALTSHDRAARQEPASLRYRLPLADLYGRLGAPALARQVLDDGLALAPAADPSRPAAERLLAAVALPGGPRGQRVEAPPLTFEPDLGALGGPPSPGAPPLPCASGRTSERYRPLPAPGAPAATLPDVPSLPVRPVPDGNTPSPLAPAGSTATPARPSPR
jgi:hypothetical protein